MIRLGLMQAGYKTIQISWCSEIPVKVFKVKPNPFLASGDSK